MKDIYIVTQHVVSTRRDNTFVFEEKKQADAMFYKMLAVPGSSTTQDSGNLYVISVVKHQVYEKEDGKALLIELFGKDALR